MNTSLNSAARGASRLRPTGGFVSVGLVGLLLAGSLGAGPAALLAQDNLPGAAGELMLRNLRPTGQPVIPLFDGWYHNPDGSFELCFGYHNLNTAQAIDIPLGPDNVLEPARFNGWQPTYFEEVPGIYRRRFCIFTVHLDDLEDAPDVVWSLRVGGQVYTVPGSSSEHYRMDEIRQSSRGNSAPLVRIEEPAGFGEHRGRATMMPDASASARVGQPLTLAISVTDPEDVPLGVTRVIWGKHAGPGDVLFSQEETEVEESSVTFRHTATATFSEPGDYILRLQTVDWDLGNAFGFHCCWTNRFVRVSVTN